MVYFKCARVLKLLLNDRINIVIIAFIIFVLLVSPLNLISAELEGEISSSDLQVDRDNSMRSAGRAAAKNLSLYLHESTTAKYVFDYSTTTIMNTMVGNNQQHLTDWGSVVISWYLHPVLAGDFHINGDIFFSMNVNMSSESNNMNGNFDVTLYDVSFIDAGGARTESAIPGASGNDAKTFATSISSYGLSMTNVDYVVPSGHSIRLEFSVSGGASNKYHIWFGDNIYDSRIELPSESYLHVNEVFTVNNQGLPQNNFEIDSSNKDIEIRTNVTDPLGGYDIKMVNATLLSPTGAIILDNVSMTKYEGTDISFVSKYSLPWNYSGYSIGKYDIIVWAVDYNGYNYFYHRLKFNFGNFDSTNTSYFYIGSTEITGNITVYDSLGLPLEGASVKAQLGGVTLITNVTNSTGIASLVGYPGIYTIIVEWQDVVVKVHSNFDFKLDFPIELTCDVFYPEFNIVDSSLDPLVGASVYIGHPNGSFLVSPVITDIDGMIFLDRVPVGNLQLIVKWRDVEVASELEYIDTNGLIDVIVCDVYSVQLTAVDSKGFGLPKAQFVIIDDISNLVLDSKISSLTGLISSQLPRGNYTVNIYWLNRLVQQVDLSVNSDVVNTISCMVYYVNFKLLDTHGIPVDNAIVQITDKDTDGVLDSGTSSLDGLFESRLPVGESNIKVIWKNIIVNRSSVMITADAPELSAIILNCEIYYLTLNCYDNHGVALENAFAEIYQASTDILLDSSETGAEGSAVFRMPVSVYDFNIFWLNTEVYSRMNFDLTQDATLALQCMVYYSNVTAVDSRNVFLENARIEISDKNTDTLIDVKTVGANGKALFRLPTGSYLVEVTWLDINVSQSIQSFVKDSEVVINCRVYYYTAKVVDIDSVPVESANVAVINTQVSKIFSSNKTDSEGTIVTRLPHGFYTLEITWKGVMVFEDCNCTVTKDETSTYSVKIYYLNVKAFDKDKGKLKDVLVLVTNKDTNTDLIESGYTDSSGTIQFRLPYGTYDLKGRLITTHLMADIDKTLMSEVDLQTGSKEVELKFDEYPPSFVSTPAFGITMFAVVVILLFLFLWLFVIRKLKKKAGEEKEPQRTELPLAVPAATPAPLAEPAPAKEEPEDKEPEEKPEDKPEADTSTEYLQGVITPSEKSRQSGSDDEEIELPKFP
jgi:large-conductance mechanosensitive channel